MKVLIACEFSGIVRDAFRDLGHDAWSCDLLDSERDNRYHIKGSVFQVTSPDFDLMICHPPCTHLAVSGARWWKDKDPQLQLAAIGFCKFLLSAPIAKIALENPIGKLSSAIRKPEQIIQPWQFGHGETKATCLWLKNLPPLRATQCVSGRDNRVHRETPGSDRWQRRSRTLPGIALAMATQWGMT